MGFRGHRHSEEARKKMSDAVRAHYASATEEEREARSNSMKGNKRQKWQGRKHTEEAKRKISIAAMGNKRTKGMKLSEEHKRKIGDAHRGLKLSEESRAKIGAARKGKPGTKLSQESRDKLSAAVKGRVKSPEHRAKISATLKGVKLSPERCANMSAARRKQWEDPAYREMLRKAWDLKPNKDESFLLNLLEELYPGEWKYTGDFSVVINGKNPDFINCNGQKKIIEFFGDYWHQGDDPKERAAAFEPFGYKTLVIWGHEFSDMKKVEVRLHEFMKL